MAILSTPLGRIAAASPVSNPRSQNSTETLGSNLWCGTNNPPNALDGPILRIPNRLYICLNYGSKHHSRELKPGPPQHLIEFAWGLARSNQNFLWIIRPHLVL
ncbi:hypothetical protein Dimus_009583 [Dionaea muscipula]